MGLGVPVISLKETGKVGYEIPQDRYEEAVKGALNRTHVSLTCLGLTGGATPPSSINLTTLEAQYFAKTTSQDPVSGTWVRPDLVWPLPICPQAHYLPSKSLLKVYLLMVADDPKKSSVRPPTSHTLDPSQHLTLSLLHFSCHPLTQHMKNLVILSFLIYEKQFQSTA